MSPRVALATCAAYPDLEAPERLVLDPLAAAGVEAVPAVWDDDVQWSSFDLVVLRGTWDYAERLAEFDAWLDAVATVTLVANPPPVVRWNVDKRYLADLAGAGVPVVPTTFLSPGQAPRLPDRGEFVVKPTISAGSRETARYLAGRDDAAAHAHARRLLGHGRQVMVQPYLSGVDDRGETALLHLAGEYSHAVRKGPLLTSGAPPTTELFAAETITARQPDPAERAVAAAVMAWLEERFGTLLYARVDLLPTSAGPVVLEVELVEPSLFLDTAEDAPRRLAEAIAGALRRR